MKKISIRELQWVMAAMQRQERNADGLRAPLNEEIVISTVGRIHALNLTLVSASDTSHSLVASAGSCARAASFAGPTRPAISPGPDGP
jgi:hypothetical protein